MSTPIFSKNTERDIIELLESIHHEIREIKIVLRQIRGNTQ